METTFCMHIARIGSYAPHNGIYFSKMLYALNVQYVIQPIKRNKTDIYAFILKACGVFFFSIRKCTLAALFVIFFNNSVPIINNNPKVCLLGLYEGENKNMLLNCKMCEWALKKCTATETIRIDENFTNSAPMKLFHYNDNNNYYYRFCSDEKQNR